MASSTMDRLLLVEKVLLLKSLSLFKDTPEHILADLAPLMQEVEYEKGEEVFGENEIGDCMYIISSGEIRIHKGTTTLAILKEKEVFGELSLLDAETRSASATAHTDCTLFRIDQEPFYELLESRPEVARGFIRILCQRLRAQNEKARQNQEG
ncbi:cyclic nucleotide-binding domain-containing protein [Flavihumibacter rivuli]|uniref:Crp/Fnr family transcriptional regulator n=1 Tax=Flavihumibacter rivuli TaxID=2838156 RepID=UPI001BDF184B|nr:cyclic nucleotide-binding domain-containing protein [Flavihumibacter rivuli]ULQ58279.1 cyclic nucleotide-binding domain-containing protein [Flavihumibacter rivuli]